MSTTKNAEPSAPARPVSMRRIAMASCVGTTIEFYDFFIYGTAAALVFPTVFFPSLGATAGTVASFATFAVAFVARPVGAVVFGHFGDRIGRKRTLVSTLLTMGVATALIGVLPSSSTIGILAPIALVMLRLAQGFAVGGEWAGATLLTAEYAPEGRRGRYGVFPQLGPSIAFGLSSGTFLITGLLLGDTDGAFLSYGWRIPFLLSILLVGLGLWVRLSIEETPAFRESQAKLDTSRHSPFREAVRAQPREILLVAGSLAMLFAFFYMGTAYLTAYGTNPDGAALSRPTVLTIGLGASVVFGLATAASGILSDRFGRRRVIVTACVFGIAWGLALFPILDTESPLAFALGVTVSLVVFAVSYGPAAAFLPELFETRYRYTAAGFSYGLAAVLGGAIPPLLAPGLAAEYGSRSIGVMLAVISAMSLVCTLMLVETRGRGLRQDSAG
ncbi:MFS transporter [Nocardioides sp. Root140]|nr:MFS transporter [Nocardioides sp. Root140]KRF17572.1 MFS transporter [Nocardioides sp. Soil796]